MIDKSRSHNVYFILRNEEIMKWLNTWRFWNPNLFRWLQTTKAFAQHYHSWKFNVLCCLKFNNQNHFGLKSTFYFTVVFQPATTAILFIKSNWKRKYDFFNTREIIRTEKQWRKIVKFSALFTKSIHVD